MTEFDAHSAESCLNFPVNVRSLPPRGLTLALETDEKERAALAKAHGLAAVRAFSVSCALTPWKKRGVRLSGHIKAEIAQQCVITAEMIENKIDRDFEAYFLPADSCLAKQPEGAHNELFLDPEGADAPESFSGGSLNIGAAAEEFFELFIDPYPRKKGARLEARRDEAGLSPAAAAALQPSAEEKPLSPFAALKALKNKGKG